MKRTLQDEAYTVHSESMYFNTNQKDGLITIARAGMKTWYTNFGLYWFGKHGLDRSMFIRTLRFISAKPKTFKSYIEDKQYKILNDFKKETV